MSRAPRPRRPASRRRPPAAPAETHDAGRAGPPWPPPFVCRDGKMIIDLVYVRPSPPEGSAR